MSGQGLPSTLKIDVSGTNPYRGVDMSGAEKQSQMLRMLTGGKKGNVKRGGATLSPQTVDGGKIIVPQFPNGGTAANQINANLMQIAGQANANSSFDNQKGGRRRRRSAKKTKRSRKGKRGNKIKKTRRRYK
jgi:hypothetical protein